MALDRDPGGQGPQDEVLSKVDALLRRHRGGGLDEALDAGPEPEIPTLTDLVEGSPAPTDVEPPQPDAPAPPVEALSQPSEQAWLALLQPEIERVVIETLSARLPQAIQEQVMPEVMLHLGEGLNRLRDAMRATVESVVRETIEREVKRALKALLKERTDR
jgi:hypothetical protein